MRFNHLGHQVRDRQRARAFYETYFGFDEGPAQEYEEGTLIIRDADGFDLALHEGTGPPPAFLHFGVRLSDEAAVRDLHARLTADGVPVLEHVVEPGFASLKCRDPDGYTVEAYWE